MAESPQIDVELETNSIEKAHNKQDKFNHKMETIFLIANFLLELPSAVFDQLSSVRRSQYALLSMLMSLSVLVISVVDLVYKGRKEGVFFTKKGLMLWFFYPHPNSKPFGKFPDIIGLVCAFFQWIFASIGYAFLSRNADNPVRVSVWPLVFALGLLYSKLSGNFLLRGSNTNLRKLQSAEEFTLAELAAATNDFSADNKVGKGRFGIIYKGRLKDGREVAIKRRDVQKQEKIEEESAFKSELVHSTRLHHKHLVGLVGYCEEGIERLSVFDYMLYDLYCLLFLMDRNLIDSWVIRIKIALEAARGIDYLHNYAVPPIIHRGIKSSCILLDANWTAKIAEFDWAVRGLESQQVPLADGYVDPEFSGENVLTEMSDVHSFGVVLLELLTGKPATLCSVESGSTTKYLVEFAVPKILGNELPLILDHRIGSPGSDSEAEAIELVAYTALHCVNSDGINRPNIRSVVSNLEQAFSLLSRCNSCLVDESNL